MRIPVGLDPGWRIKRDSKDRYHLIIALDRTVPESFQQAPVLHGFGDFGIHQDFLVGCRRAQAGCEIYHTADGGIVEPAFVPDPPNRCRATGKTYSEPDLVPLRSPA